MNRLIKTIMMAAIGLTMIAGSAYADLGWTAKQAVNGYGKPVKTGKENDGREWGDFKTANGYYVTLWFLNGTVSRAAYARVDGQRLSGKEVHALITANAPDDTEWGQAYSDAQGNGHVDSTDGGYFSMLTADEKVVAVWIKADNDLVAQKKENQNQQEEQEQTRPVKKHSKAQPTPEEQQPENNDETQ